THELRRRRAALTDVPVELRAQVDDAYVLGEKLGVERAAGLGVLLGLALQIPGLRQVEPQLHQQHQADYHEQRLPAPQALTRRTYGEIALGQVEGRATPGGQEAIG